LISPGLIRSEMALPAAFEKCSVKSSLWKTSARLRRVAFGSLKNGQHIAGSQFFVKINGGIALWKNCVLRVESAALIRSIFSCSSRFI